MDSQNSERRRLLHSETDGSKSSSLKAENDITTGKLPKGKTIKNFIVINVLILFYVVGLKMVDPLAYQYVYYRRLKINLPNVTDKDISSNPCSNTTGSNDTEKEARNQAQSSASQWIMYCTLTSQIPAVFVSLIYGSLSDSYGRKPLFIASVLGLLGKASVLCCVVRWELPLYWLVMGYSMDGFGGSFSVFLVSMYSSIADIIPAHRNRTLYFALSNISIAIAALCGSLSLGTIITKFGFLYPSLTCVGFLVIALLFATLGIEETFSGSNRIEKLSRFLLKAFKFYFVKDGNSNRCAYIILIAMMFWAPFPITSRVTVETLYIANQPFCFSSFKISLFQASFAVREAISVFSIMILQKCCNNEQLTLISLISNITGLLMESFSNSTWQIYLVPALSMFGTMMFSTMRGIISNLTSPDDQGSLFAGVMAVETITSLLSGTFANLVYQWTFDVFKGSVFLFYAGTQSLSTLLMLCYMCLPSDKRDSGK